MKLKKFSDEKPDYGQPVLAGLTEAEESDKENPKKSNEIAEWVMVTRISTDKAGEHYKVINIDEKGNPHTMDVNEDEMICWVADLPTSTK